MTVIELLMAVLVGLLLQYAVIYFAVLKALEVHTYRKYKRELDAYEAEDLET